MYNLGRRKKKEKRKKESQSSLWLIWCERELYVSLQLENLGFRNTGTAVKHFNFPWFHKSSFIENTFSVIQDRFRVQRFQRARLAIGREIRKPTGSQASAVLVLHSAMQYCRQNSMDLFYETPPDLAVRSTVHNQRRCRNSYELFLLLSLLLCKDKFLPSLFPPCLSSSIV